MSKKTGQLNVSVNSEQEAFITALAKYRITGPELVRGLLDASADFYRRNGWFSFPVIVIPEKFQAGLPPIPPPASIVSQKPA